MLKYKMMNGGSFDDSDIRYLANPAIKGKPGITLDDLSEKELSDAIVKYAKVDLAAWFSNNDINSEKKPLIYIFKGKNLILPNRLVSQYKLMNGSFDDLDIECFLELEAQKQPDTDFLSLSDEELSRIVTDHIIDDLTFCL